MKKKAIFVAEPLLMSLYGAFAVFFIILSVTMFSVHNYEFAWFFLAFVLFFGIIAAFYGMLVIVTPEGVCQRFLFIPVRRLTWDEVKEIGVLGSRPPFKGQAAKVSKRAKKPGMLYFYLSTKELTEDEKFDLVLKWPPFHLCFFRYSQKRFETMQFFADREMKMYNTGALSLGSYINEQ